MFMQWTRHPMMMVVVVVVVVVAAAMTMTMVVISECCCYLYAVFNVTETRCSVGSCIVGVLPRNDVQHERIGRDGITATWDHVSTFQQAKKRPKYAHKYVCEANKNGRRTNDGKNAGMELKVLGSRKGEALRGHVPVIHGIRVAR